MARLPCRIKLPDRHTVIGGQEEGAGFNRSAGMGDLQLTPSRRIAREDTFAETETMKPLPVITKDEEIRNLKRMNAKLRKLLTDALDEMVRMSDSRLPTVEKSAK
jgi:hypothetical protein